MIMLELRMGILEKELFLFLKGGWLRFERNGRQKLKYHHFAWCYFMLQMMSSSSILYSLFLNHIFYSSSLYILFPKY